MKDKNLDEALTIALAEKLWFRGLISEEELLKIKKKIAEKMA